MVTSQERAVPNRKDSDAGLIRQTTATTL